MRFCDWVPLEKSGAAVPDRPGIFQIRIEHGLIRYPQGKSAMFYYGYGPSLRQGVDAFRRRILPTLRRSEEELLVRWMETEEVEAHFRSYLARFATKFGSLPEGNEVQLRGKS